MQIGHVSRSERRRVRQLLVMAAMGGALIAAPQLANAANHTLTGSPNAQTITDTDPTVNVDTDSTFEVNTTSGSALTITGGGDVTYDDGGLNNNLITTSNGSTDSGLRITATNSITVNSGGTISSDGWYGVWAQNSGDGNISITTGGTVTGLGDAGIHAQNTSATGGTITIEANGDVIGDYNQTGAFPNDDIGVGIWAVNNSTALADTDLAIDITTTGDVTGGAGSIDGGIGGGINAEAASGSIRINATGDVTGSDTGIYADAGAGNINITSTGAITGTNEYGIYINDGGVNTAGDRTVDVANVTGGKTGIHIHADGPHDINVTSSGTVTGETSDAIYLYNHDIGNLAAAGVGDVNVDVNNVTGGASGINAQNLAKGGISITATGTVSGNTGYGIYALNSNGGSTGDISITTADVSTNSTAAAIYAQNNGAGGITVDSTAGSLNANSGDGTNNSWYGVYAVTSVASEGDINITTADVKGLDTAIYALQQGTGNLIIDTTAGSVEGDTDGGAGNGVDAAITNGSATGNLEITTADVSSRTGYGINASNAGTGDVIIDTTAGAVSAGAHGIVVVNSGGDDSDTTITTGDVTSTGVGPGANGIVATISNGNSTGDLTIHTEGVVQTDGWDGINATNNSTGNIDITTDDTVIGWGNTGITAVQNGSDATNGRILITTHGDVTGDNAQPGNSPVNGNDPSTNHDGIGYGIYADNNNTLVAAGSDAITIIADPTTTIEGNEGVFAQTSSGDITVDVGNATGQAYGIHTMNNDAADAQQGGSNVIVRGNVDGGIAGIYQWSFGDINTSIESGATVSNSDGLSTSDAIVYDGWAGYTNHLTINSDGLLTGNVNSGASGQDIIDNFGTWNNAGGTSDLDLGVGSEFNNQIGGSYLAANTTSAVTTTLLNTDNVNDLGGDFVMQNMDTRIGGGTAFVGDVIAMPQSTFVTGGGNLLVDTDIANGLSDELHVQNITLGQVLSDPGDPGSALVDAPTFVNVNVTDGLGQPTAPYNNGDGILVAYVSDTSDADALQLDAPLRGGLYSYSLQQGANDFVNNGTQSWYLQAGINAEALAAGSASVMGSRSALASLSNLHDRQRDVETLSDYSESRKGVWGRVFGQGNDFESNVSDGSGTSATSGFESDLWGVQAGLDFIAKGDEAGNRKYAGLYVAYADSSGHYTDNGTRLGKMDMNTTSLGAYYTKYSASNWYLDLVGQYSHLGSVKIQSADNDIKSGGNSYALSLEVGKQFNPESRIIREVQAQLIDQYTNMDDITLNDGTQMAVSSVNSVTGRFGVRLYGNPRSGKSFLPWARANIWHTFSADTKVSSLGNTLSTPIGGTSGELELGFSKGNAQSGGWGLYGSAGYLFDISGAEYSGWKGTLGLRKGW